MQKKLYNKKKIYSILRNGNRTEIYKMVARINGNKPSQGDVYRFICDNAPSNRVVHSAYEIAYNPYPKIGLDLYSRICKSDHEYRMRHIKKEIVDYIKKQISEVETTYTKVPMIIRGWLTFASKIYGANDYNIWWALPYEGNEKFCDTIISLAHKYIQY